MKLLAVSDVAKHLNCSTTQVYRLLAEGFLQDFRCGHRHYVEASSLDHYCKTHKQDGIVNTSLEYARLVKAFSDLSEK